MMQQILQRLRRRTSRPLSSKPRNRWRIAAAAVGLTLGATSATAAIIAVVPSVVLFVPLNVSLNQTQSNTQIAAFDEKQCIVLAADLQTDQGVIPKNTRISSHFLHTDPVSVSLLSGRAQFDSDIIGVISTSAKLDASDVPCGRAGVIYPVPGTELNRGLEAFQPNDQYTIISSRVIQIQTDVPSFSDQVRVITCCRELCPDAH